MVTEIDMTNDGKKPCILCKFGCGQQVSFDYREFSDGYSYVIYRDFDDGNFHDCPEIPHHELNWSQNSAEIILEMQNKGMDIKNEVNNSEFKKLFWRNVEFHSVNMIISDDESENTEAEKVEHRRELEAAKVMCSILPIPFFRLFQSRESNTTYLLTKLAEKYQKNGDYDNASIALSIQNEITHDQTDRIIELQNLIAKKSNMPELDPVQDVLEKMNIMKLDLMKEKMEKESKKHREKMDGKKADWELAKFNLLKRVDIDKKWSDKIFEHQKNKTDKEAEQINELIRELREKKFMTPKWKAEQRGLDKLRKHARHELKKIKHTNEESLNREIKEISTVNEIREKIREVERMLKLFISKSFNDDMNQFKEIFPQICEEAERKREKSKIDTLDVPEGNIMDYITLGAIISIITRQEYSKYFPKWIFTYNTMLHNITSFRNNTDHYTGKNIEEFFANEDKIMVDIYCNKILNLLNKFNNQ